MAILNSVAAWPHGLRALPCVPAAALMSSVYEDHKDEDGFLYITYSGENTFGSSDSSSDASNSSALRELLAC
jgi:hypothetical protein